MYHSLYFFRVNIEDLDLDNAINSYEDWHIVPLSRPVIAPPKQKLVQIDIPGANGILDLSNSLTHYPVFDNREGTLEFAVLNDITDWNTAYTTILRFLQGVNVRMILEDDPNYFYEGRVYVDKWNSKNDGTWSVITLGYDLYPYRLSVKSSNDDWLWDPFNFETDFVQQTAFTAIQVDTTGTDDWDERDFTGLIDMMPVIPTFTVDVEEGENIQAQLYNSDMLINWRDLTLTSGTYKLYNCILCENTPESVVKMRFKGKGQITMNFRSGRL